jgi:outer membrane protein insertion porin family/translocation and assembly module TamA
MERPEVRKVDFRGVAHADKGDLGVSVATEASKCSSFLLRVVCLFTRSPAVYNLRYLDREELARDILRVRVYYWRRGYREARVDTVVTPVADDAVKVAFLIEEGPPTLVDTVVVTGTDSLLPADAMRRLLALRVGEPLSLLSLDTTVTKLRDALWEMGYADAMLDTGVVVDSAARTAAVRIDVEPRWLTRVGPIGVQGLEKLSPATVRNSIVLHQGDVFRRSDMLRSQRSLYESSLFQRANIEAVGDSATKRIVVQVKEGDLQTARMAAGFSTVDYVQVDGRYTNFNFLGGARRLQLQLTLGNLLASALEDEFIFAKLGVTDDFSGERSPFLRPTWQASLELRQPWIGNPRNTLGTSIFAHRRSTPGVVVDRGQGVTASFTRNIAPRTDLSASYRFEVARVEAADVYFCVNFGICDPATINAVSQAQRLSPVAIIASANRADDPLEPHHGYTASLTLEHASQYTASDFRYHRATGDAAAYRPVGPGVLAGHVRIGWSQALSSESLDIPGFGNVDVLHPRKRFYAGGSRSVRGYGENQLGPRVLTIAPSRLLELGCTPPFDTCANLTATDSTGTDRVLGDGEFNARPIGGSGVAEASAEYRFPVWGPLLGAAFVDAAILTGSDNELFTLDDNFMAVTPGIGVRYRSPVGPIRVDVAYRPRVRGEGNARGEGLPVLTQVLVDGQQRIVRVGSALPLDQQPLRIFDADRGFFSRIALHLSIGEAF